MRNYGMPRMAPNCPMQCGEGQTGESCLSEPEFAVAMAYVPWQHYKDTYELDKALEIGTIFPELNRPFMARRGTFR